MLQPPYSPDLAPCDFFLFQKVKSAVKGYRFESTEDIHSSVTQTFKQHATKYVQRMLQIMTAPLERVCAGTRDVL